MPRKPQTDEQEVQSEELTTAEIVQNEFGQSDEVVDETPVSEGDGGTVLAG